MSDKRKYFGTDGIRGEANKPPLTPDFALRLGVALTKLIRAKQGKKRPQILIGKDTRLSGYMLEQALCAGFTAAGADVTLVGPLPTPAVAYLSRERDIDLGIMISASHNPYQDNGIKIFGHDGYKISDEDELKVEALVDSADILENLAETDDIGKAFRHDGALSEYQLFLIKTLGHKFSHDTFKAVVDCANGAAYKVAPHLLRNLGIETIAIHGEPDGKNINDHCGATHLESLQSRVRAAQADIGIALDGDADRLILTDELGNIIDGDQIMALLARGFAEEGALKKNKIAATVMSNLGLEEFLKSINVELVRTPVGDRHVVAEMKAQGLSLGGEQAGHLILGDYATTGDGLLAALHVIRFWRASGKKASEFLSVFKPFPQVLKNVRFEGESPLQKNAVKEAIKNGETKLKTSGRLLVRASGTEPLIRVMAEGRDLQFITNVVDEICGEIEKFGKAS